MTGSARQCPRCAETLSPGSYADVSVELCPGCSGMLVPRNGMIPLMEKLAAELMQTIDPDAAIEALPPGEAGIPCPICQSPMEQNGYMGSNLVHVDACDRCTVTWLDPADLGGMTLLWARTERRLEGRRQAFKEAETSSLISGLLLARAVQRSLLRGFIR